MEDKVLVVASAGGHLTQAICAIDECKNIVLVSNKINLEDRRVKKIYKIIDTQHNPFVHFLNLFFASYVLLRERPRVVFSTGGPIVLPFALICRIFSTRFVFLDTLSRVVELSNTGKLIKKYNLYDEFFSQWPNIAKKNNVKYIGKCFDIVGENKTRDEAGQVLGEGEIPLILVTLGTNDYPFSRAIDFICKMDLYKDKRVEWVVQVGENKVKELPANGRIISMVGRKEMDGYVKRASLVISHCGIGSINQMLRYRKRVVFLPRVKKYGEFSDDHQLQIASELRNPMLTIVYPECDSFRFSYETLMSQVIIRKPIEIVNKLMSKKLKSIFFKVNNERRV